MKYVSGGVRQQASITAIVVVVHVFLLLLFDAARAPMTERPRLTSTARVVVTLRLPSLPQQSISRPEYRAQRIQKTQQPNKSRTGTQQRHDSQDTSEPQTKESPISPAMSAVEESGTAGKGQAPLRTRLIVVPPPTLAERARDSLPKPEAATLDRKVSGAARKDCRNAYSGMGLFAIPRLVLDSVTDDGCKW